MTRNEKGPAKAPASTAPAPAGAELTEAQAREHLASLQTEAAAATPAARPAPETLAAALAPDGLTVLGVALIERALAVFPGAGASLLLAVLWALEHQRDLRALTLDAESLQREAAALGARIPAGQLRGLVKQAERVIDALPGALDYVYHLEPVVVGAAVPEDLVALVEPGAVAEGKDGTRWGNSTGLRLVVRKVEAAPGE